MTTQTLQAIVLAGGKAARFKTGKSKLLEKICGQEVVVYSTKLLEALKIPTTAVVSYQKEKIKEAIKKHHGDSIPFAEQEKPNGTAHAILYTEETWHADNILVIYGDMPLVTPEIIAALYHKHRESNSALSFTIAHNPDPTIKTYGRIVKGKKQIKVIQPSEFHGDTNEHCCVNAGIYIIRREFLAKYIHEIANKETDREQNLSDLVALASKQHKVATISVPFDRIRGVCTMQELWAAEHIKRAELISYWMENGVRFSVAHNVHIDLDVTIGKGSYIGCGAHLVRGTKVGRNCQIHEFSALENVTLGDNSIIEPHCIIKDSVVGCNAIVGPFVHIREKSKIGDNATIGNFIEIKKSVIGDNLCAKHITYLGDAKIGNNVKIGAGTIVCNHNGKNTNETTIKDNVRIGSSSTIVAPVTIEQNSYTAPGSVIVDDVPEGSLAVATAPQINKENYIGKNKDTVKNELDMIHNSHSFVGAIKTEGETSLPDQT